VTYQDAIPIARRAVPVPRAANLTHRFLLESVSVFSIV
jgi:hypothetical protein